MKKLRWKRLTRELQDLYLKLLWEDACSEKAIADFLRTTKGIIVRRRHSLPDLDAPNRKKVNMAVDPERFRDLLELHKLGQKAAKKKRKGGRDGFS